MEVVAATFRRTSKSRQVHSLSGARPFGRAPSALTERTWVAATRRFSARVISAGHAFVQNLHRGHYELGLDVGPKHRLSAALTELILAI